MEDFLFDFGDIIWCKRDFNGQEIEDRHKTGPFIFLCCKNDYMYCIKGSGIKNNQRRNNNSFVIDDNNYHLRKTTEFRTREIVKVPVSCYLTYIDSLKEEDLDDLKRILSVLRNRFEDLEQVAEEIDIDLNVDYKIGTIIKKDGKRYLILKENDNGTFDIVPFLYDEENKIHISLNEFKSNVDCSTFTIDGILHDVNQKYIDAHKFSYKHKNLEDTEIRLGSIIIVEGLIYYVSTIEANQLVTYKISLDNEETNIKLLGEDLYIDFEQERINKEEARLICNLSEDEIDLIREAKKKSKYTKKHSKKHFQTQINPYDCFGKILYYKHNLNMKYGLYKVINPNKIVVVDLNYLLNTGRMKFETKDVNSFGLKTDEHSELVSIIRSIENVAEDTRYLKFLFINGCFDEYVQAGGRCRKRRK